MAPRSGPGRCPVLTWCSPPTASRSASQAAPPHPGPRRAKLPEASDPADAPRSGEPVPYAAAGSGVPQVAGPRDGSTRPSPMSPAQLAGSACFLPDDSGREGLCPVPGIALLATIFASTRGLSRAATDSYLMRFQALLSTIYRGSTAMPQPAPRQVLLDHAR